MPIIFFYLFYYPLYCTLECITVTRCVTIFFSPSWEGEYLLHVTIESDSKDKNFRIYWIAAWYIPH